MKRAAIVSYAYRNKVTEKIYSGSEIVFYDSLQEFENSRELNEVKDRIKSAINNEGYEVIDSQITVNVVTDKIAREFPVGNMDLLHKMAGSEEPFGLFEPRLWKDKIGDSLWHCEMLSVGGMLAEGIDGTMEGAIRKCYDDFVKRDDDGTGTGICGPGEPGAGVDAAGG